MKIWLHVTSGQGPEECAWVASKITQLILQEATTAGFRVQLVEAVQGKSASSLLSALISLEGEDLRQFINSWTGTVQWIGRSPFRPFHARKNWFIGVEAVTAPENDYKLVEKDCDIKAVRASGPGGQHVNKTESAIQITHLPTGIVVKAQEERSQHLNKKLALARLINLLKTKQAEKDLNRQKERWEQHHALERGNSKRLYKGEKFIRLR
ncbi:peptide chain release factor H [Candidatus Odyssella thessalonicensis]|uniref:peptide chain release factor H n=1 Tax=Candidatus Odyssella thessalonicensis TaxID=84647 RepID=UPI000225A9D1|nr:peptide chain release factor H [Candidatus Odyssella thessalonicensis]